MIRVLQSLICISAICGVIPANANDPVSVSGVLTLRSGAQVDAKQIRTQIWTNSGKISFTMVDGVKRDVNITDVASMHFDHLETSKHGDIDGSNKNAIVVTLSNGNEAIARDMSGKAEVRADFLDSFTGKETLNKFYRLNGASEKGGSPTDVVHIDFTGAGNIRKNMTTGQYYPVNYQFDPYTGDKLDLVRLAQKTKRRLQAVMSIDPCIAPGALCMDKSGGGRSCSLPDQTPVSCGPAPSDVRQSRINVLLDVVKTSLALAGFDAIATTIDSTERTMSISAEVTEGESGQAADRAKEAIVAISTTALTGVGGMLAMFSEPEVIDGKLYMKVRLPFVFFKPVEPVTNI